jgi:hypothetical protein
MAARQVLSGERRSGRISCQLASTNVTGAPYRIAKHGNCKQGKPAIKTAVPASLYMPDDDQVAQYLKRDEASDIRMRIDCSRLKFLRRAANQGAAKRIRHG